MNETVYLVDENEDKAAELLLHLTDANYRVRLFTDLNDFLSAIRGGEQAAAIVINTSITGANHAGIHAIAQLTQEHQPLPPVIFVSEHTDMATRLAATRAGGRYFFNDPMGQNALCSALDEALSDNGETKPYKVLMIGSSPSQLLYYREVLKDNRLTLKTLSQPLDVLTTLQSFNADVIVTDVSLPECSGIELSQVVRQSSMAVQIPIIFLYGKADEHLHLEAMRAGGDAFFTKSMAAEHLIEAIIAKAKRSGSEKQLDRQIQQILNHSESYHFAMDQHDIVSIANTRGKITEVNDKFCTISGYSREELIGQNHRLLKSGYHPPSFYDDMWHTISSGKVWHGVICNKTKAGEDYWVNSTIVPFLDRKGAPWQYISVRTDITALRISEDRLQRAQNFANIGTWDWNIHTGEVLWSDRIGPLYGYPLGPMETTFENFQKALHPEDRELVNQAINDCIEHGTAYASEHRVVWPDGSVHWSQESGDIIYNARGEAVRMIGVAQDITDRKAVELRLQEERRRLQQAQQMGAMGDWWVNFSDNLPHYSDEALHIMGQQSFAGELTLGDALAKIDPADRKALIADNKIVLKHGQSKLDLRIYPDSHTLRWVQQVARRLICDQNGRATGWRGTVQDITERKEAEYRQVNNNYILENIAKDAPLTDTLSLLMLQVESAQVDRYGVVLIADPVSGKLHCGAAPSLPTHLTDALDNLSLDTSKTVNPQSIINDISSHPSWESLNKVSAQAGFTICCAQVIPSSSGQLLGILLMYRTGPHQMDTSCATLTREAARFAAIALEQKQVLWELMTAKEDAENANQAKSQFLSRISHDLRTPLTAIMGFGQLLDMDKKSPLSERQQSYVLEINKAGEHLLELINDILSLAQIENGRVDFSLEAINVCELVAECESLIAPLAEEREITFTTALTEIKKPPGQQHFVEADRKRLKQILLNLLSNAVKYNRHGGTITLSCEPSGRNLRILVTDTGEGLSEAQQMLLFSAFERLGAENKGILGSGIGLMIAKGLIESMAGAIGVESMPGKGSTFWIELPSTLE